jgi:hypothetical protein
MGRIFFHKFPFVRTFQKRDERFSAAHPFPSQQNEIGLVQNNRQHVVKLFGRIDDDEVKRLRQNVERFIDIRGRDASGVFGVKRFSQNPHSASRLNQRAIEKKRVDAFEIFGQIENRVRRLDIEKTRHRAELQNQVDETNGLSLAGQARC